MRRILMTAALAPLFTAPQVAARTTFRPPPVIRHSSGVTQRKRLNVNDLIAAPGTLEIDWATLYSYTTSTLTLPSAIRYTPDGNSLLLGRTEYSVAFDSVSSAVNTGTRSTQFSDRLTFAATSVVYGSSHFDVALAPQLTTLLRGDSGIRAGATTIARYDGGGNTIAGSVSWTGATTASDTNPSGTWDFGAGFGRQLAQKGLLSQFTPHANLTLEKSTGFDRTLAIFGGIEYQLTQRIAIDFSGQRFGLVGGGDDRQLLVGLTINLGELVK
jgi:hypothetical protein